jgi:hypothetical protein
MTTDIVRAPWCKLTHIGLKIERRPSRTEWEATGTQISDWRRTIHFWLGDWALAGEEIFGEEAVTFVEELAEQYGFDPHTVINDRSVMRAIPYARRRPGLSFAHHAAVAKFAPDVQDKLLRQAEAEKLPAARFREAIRGQVLPDMRDPLPLIRDAIAASHKAQALAHGGAKIAIGHAIAALQDAEGMIKNAPAEAAILQPA